mgnify:CR=1 FL=1
MVDSYKEKLKKLMDDYVNFVYDATSSFPREETYGSVSQWRRATLSIILNYIEGYARQRSLVQLNFYEMSYGSFRESKYLLYFASKRKFIPESDFREGFRLVKKLVKCSGLKLTR